MRFWSVSTVAFVIARVRIVAGALFAFASAEPEAPTITNFFAAAS